MTNYLKYDGPVFKNQEFQTSFGYSHDHFSETHQNHYFGSTAPVQRDFGLNLPDGRFRPLVAETSPLKEFQTTLPDFGAFKKSGW